MLIFVCLLLCLTVVQATNESSPIDPIVTTDWATIRGLRQTVLGCEVDAFLGIPFAKPPIGELRFKRPVKPEKYLGAIYDAQTFGPACAQLPSERHNFTNVSDDCLYLNIWRPSGLSNTIQRLKPVYFYVYGSAFTDGSAIEDTLHGDILASLGNLIMVSVNYRLDFFGYGYAGSDQMPGNMGNYDVVMALEWVHDNIESFGGDPSQVTLAGDCAGAMLASSIFLSPMVPQKLYDKLYLMSGAPNPNNVIEDKEFALKKSKLLARLVGCDNSSALDDTQPISGQTIDCLRGLDYHVIKEAEMAPEITSSLVWDKYPRFQPIWGTEFLPYSPDILAERGEPRRKIHILMGNNQNEDEQSDDFVPRDKAQAYEFLYNYTLRQDVSSNMTDEYFDLIFRFYFEPIDDHDVFNLKGAVSAFIGDYFHHCPSLLFAEKWAQNGQIIHDYINEYVMDGYSRKERPYGTYHGDDDFQILGIAFREYEKFTNRDRQVTRQMIALVRDFVRGKKLHWPPMMAPRNGRVLPLVRILNDRMDPRLVRIDPKNKICHLWGKMTAIKLSF